MIKALQTLYSKSSILSLSTLYHLDDTCPHKSFFNSTLAVYREPEALSFKPGAGMPTLLKRLISKLCSENAINVLCFGLVRQILKDEGSAPFTSGPTPNRAHVLLCEEPWEWLLGTIGERRLYTLLKLATVFVREDDGMFVQVAGYPISDIQFGLDKLKSISKKIPMNRHSFLYRCGQFGLPAQGFSVQVGECSFHLSQLKHLKLLDYYCPRRVLNECTRSCPFEQHFNNVARFLNALTCLVFRKYITQRKLRAALRKNIFMFVQLRKYEKMSCDNMENSFLNPKDQAGKKHADLIRAIIDAVFETFIPKVLFYSFYITDTSYTRNKLIFIRLDDWVLITEPYKSQLIASNLRPVDYYRKGVTIASRLRLLPKDSFGSFRPIMNVKKSNQAQATRIALAVLEYHKSALPFIGASVTMGMSEIHCRIASFKSRFPKDTVFYSGKVDVEKCYDRIPLDSLFAFLERLISKPLYSIYRYDIVRPLGDGEIVKKYLRVATPVGSLPIIKRSGDILIDKCSCSKAISRQTVLDAINEAIGGGVNVHFDKIVYKLKNGIPQGSILSSLLCSLFYSEFDRIYLGKIFADPGILMLRYIDDMIVVSNSIEKVHNILSTLSTGFPDFGFFVNPEKTIFPSAAPDWFSWCGIQLSGHLEIRPDICRMIPGKISDMLTVERASNPGQALLRFVRFSVKPRIHTVFFSPLLNTSKQNMINLRDSVAFLALKLQSYIKEHDRFMSRKLGERIIMTAIRLGCRLIVSTLKSLIPSKVIKTIYYHTMLAIFAHYKSPHADAIRRVHPNLAIDTTNHLSPLLRRVFNGEMQL